MTIALDERGGDVVSTGVIERLFIHKDAIRRHLSAARLLEREAYLSQLLASGCKRQFVAERASFLLQIVERAWFMQVVVTDEEIFDRLKEWLGAAAPRELAPLRRRGKFFVAVARSWTKFLKTYVNLPQAYNAFEEAFQQFAAWLSHDLGFSASSVDSCTSGVKGFLVWLSPRCGCIASVTLKEVDAYIAERRAAGYSRHTTIRDCQALRSFFRYIETRGWSAANLSKTIRAPSQRLAGSTVHCPPWGQVRRTLASLDRPDVSHCRARAVLLLASIYGLRRSEIIRLTLEDFDWHNEVLTVRRSKRGRTQQFPIQYEVGEAVIRYLRLRPRSRFRELFLTLPAPHRPARCLGDRCGKSCLHKTPLTVRGACTHFATLARRSC